MNSFRRFFLFVTLAIFAVASQASDHTVIVFDSESMQIQFAVSDLQDALSVHGQKTVIQQISAFKQIDDGADKIVLLNINDKANKRLLKSSGIENTDELRNEGFIIKNSRDKNRTIWIAAIDDAGVMYGGLETAEIIRIRDINAIEDQFQNPYMKVRGTKFNIPLDVRTPSYTDVSDAAQNNIAEMWNFEFWKDYIDNLARYRYNTISIWSLHPFPSMVKVPEYPDIALDDVHQSTTDWKENYSLNGHGFDDPEIVDNYKVVKKISIEDKMDFWRKVMAYGKERNVQFFVLTWNIFINGTYGKYGITDKLENPVTRDYFRQSIKQMFLTYPDLAGIGLTTGENMYRYTPKQKEEWAFDTYGRGALDAIEQQPGRKINFIHRQHQTQAKEISNIFGEVINHPDINFIFSFKYAKAHVYSSVEQVYHHDFVEDIQSAGDLKTLWTLRNDDIFKLRWGAPDFVRDFMKNIPYDVSEGYYYGSDQWIWGREFLGRNSAEPRELEVEKHWYQWMLWGRLGYNPDMTNMLFMDIIRRRFPSVDAQQMFYAWQSASMIYPLVTGFHWGSLDFQWYIESGQSQPDPAKTPSGYHDINRFISLPPHRGTGFLSIPEYVKASVTGKTMAGKTPIRVASEIIGNADKALEWADKQHANGNTELQITIDDIRSISWLGKYYGHKILAATNLAMFRETYEKEWFTKAVNELNASAGYWRYYASSSLANYINPLWTNRVGYVDLRENFALALYDITMIGGDLKVPSMLPTPGGTILEAEEAGYEHSRKGNKIPGYTGGGYLETNVGDARHLVEWSYEVPESGNYTLEFRYTQRREQLFPSGVEINGKSVGKIDFWMTGEAGCWVWDRITVNLEKGKNTIRISPEGFVLLDHLNIISN